MGSGDGGGRGSCSGRPLASAGAAADNVSEALDMTTNHKFSAKAMTAKMLVPLTPSTLPILLANLCSTPQLCLVTSTP